MEAKTIANKDSYVWEPFDTAIRFSFTAQYSLDEFEAMKLGRIPSTVRSLWFIFFDSPSLYFHRSSGQAMFRLSFVEDGDRVLVSEAYCESCTLEGAGAENLAKLLAQIINDELLERGAKSQVSSGDISEIEVLDFIRAIESGEQTLTRLDSAKFRRSGNVEYLASNCWRITIYDDADEWDYIDRIDTSDGRSIDFEALDAFDSLRDYQPTLEVAISRYGIPERKRGTS